MDTVPRLFAELGPDVFPYAENMAGRSHSNQEAVIGHAVKGGVDWNPPCSKYLPHIKGDFHIGAVQIRNFFENGVERIARVHNRPPNLPGGDFTGPPSTPERRPGRRSGSRGHF